MAAGVTGGLMSFEQLFDLILDRGGLHCSQRRIIMVLGSAW